MKKYFAVILSMVFVLGLAATAFAIHAEIPSETQAVVAKGQTQITLGGSVRVRGEVRNNTDDLLDETSGGDSWSFYDERVRLSMDAKVSDQVSGSIVLEVGDDPADDSYQWGTQNDSDASGSVSAATGGYTKGNAKRGSVNLLEGWLQYKGPVGIKVGHMPLSLGNMLFFDHRKFGDDAIVLFADPSPAVHVALLTAKLAETSTTPGTATDTGDANAYVGLATFKSGMISGGADLAIVDDQQNSGAGAAAVASTRLYNLGVRATVKAGPVDIMGDVEYQFGSQDKTDAAKLAGGKDIDFAGYAVVLGAGAKLGMANVGLELGMGSGDDDANDDENGNFVTSLSSGLPYIAFLYGPRVTTACGTTNSGICNTTYAKLKAGAKSGAFSADAALIWLKATEDIVNGAGEKESDLGIEIDATVKYTIARNLVYWIEGGYLIPGDAYKKSATQDADNAYAVRHGIELTF